MKVLSLFDGMACGAIALILASRPFMDRNVQNGTLVRGCP